MKKNYNLQRQRRLIRENANSVNLMSKSIGELKLSSLDKIKYRLILYGQRLIKALFKRPWQYLTSTI